MGDLQVDAGRATAGERVVVRIHFRDAPDQRFWLLVQQPEPEVCRKPPGYDEDLVLSCDTDSLAKWHMGRLSLGHAMHARSITVDGSPRLVREFATWGGPTPFAAIKPARS